MPGVSGAGRDWARTSGAESTRAKVIRSAEIKTEGIAFHHGTPKRLPADRSAKVNGAFGCVQACRDAGPGRNRNRRSTELRIRLFGGRGRGVGGFFCGTLFCGQFSGGNHAATLGLQRGFFLGAGNVDGYADADFRMKNDPHLG